MVLPFSMTIETLLIFMALVFLPWVMVRWVLSAENPSPDPWGPEIEQAIQDRDAKPVCHSCLTPQPPMGWFCPECGTAVGQYNNYMPFLYVFSQGEVMRAGVLDHVRPSPVVVIGYLLCSLTSFAVFAPVYWYLLFRNLNSHATRSSDERATELLSP
jgi:hypothetical protein